MFRAHLSLFLMLASLTGCAGTFSSSRAEEVSRERLLQLAELEKSEHLVYMGSDHKYHYVFDARPGKADSYKVRTDKMPLRDTFRVDSDFPEEPYVLYPHVVEGKPMGTKPE